MRSGSRWMWIPIHSFDPLVLADSLGMVRLRMKCDKNDAELPHLRDFLGWGIAPAMPACYHTPGFGGGHFVGCFPFAITSMFSGGYLFVLA